MPLRVEGSKVEGSVRQNQPFSSTTLVKCLSLEKICDRGTAVNIALLKIFQDLTGSFIQEFRIKIYKRKYRMLCVWARANSFKGF